jgi:hypothetical protein
MALDERDFFNNRNETRNDTLTCPRCRRQNEYQMRWAIRTKKDRVPPGADERDRALFAKLRDYDSHRRLRRVQVVQEKFDITSQHSMVFLRGRRGPPHRRTMRMRTRASIAKKATRTAEDART